jgi:Tol biopolymer transport system component
MGLRLLSRLLVFASVASLAGGCAYLERASESGDGTQGNGESDGVALSGDGRYVAFVSVATNLAAGDTNGSADVFVRDLRTGATERVSVANDGSEGAGTVFDVPALNDDGRFVAFSSGASNLVAGDTNGIIDVFVRNRQNNITERVSVASGGAQANGRSSSPALSSDGRYVAFASDASNLVPADGNGVSDVFLRDRQSDTTERVSVATGGGEGNSNSAPPDLFAPTVAMSADARYVVFASAASNLVSGDTNGTADVFLRDRQSDETERVSLSVDGAEGDGSSEQPSVSNDGRYVAFRSVAGNLVPADSGSNEDIFVRDRQLPTTTLESAGSFPPGQGGFSSRQPALSDDGRWLAFESGAPNLVPDDTNAVNDVFVKDIGGTDVIRRVSLGVGGQQADDFSGPWVAISGDGRYAAFSSNALNLVAPDENDAFDVFVRAVVSPTIEMITPATVARGASATLTVDGTGFLPGARASASALTDPGVTVNSVTVVSENELQLSVTADPNAPTGTRHVTVWNPGTGPGPLAGASGICVGCLTVT